MTSKRNALAFEQLPELIQNLVERIEALEKTVREKQQPQPLEGELMSVDDVCKLLGKSNTSQPMVLRTIRQTPTINPTAYSAKEKQRLETLNNNGDRIKWSPLLYLTSNKFRICAMMFCFKSDNISLKCSSSFINTF